MIPATARGRFVESVLCLVWGVVCIGAVFVGLDVIL